MATAEIFNREVFVVEQDDTVLEAAKLMRLKHVDCVLVVQQRDEWVIPVGIITDRDIVLKVIATELKPEVMTASDIMDQDFQHCLEAQGLLNHLTKGYEAVP